jgi:hypothetical protein
LMPVKSTIETMWTKLVAELTEGCH